MGRQKFQKVSRFLTKAYIKNLRHASLDITFINMSTKFHTFKCNIIGAVFTQKIFMKIYRFVSLFLCTKFSLNINYIFK